MAKLIASRSPINDLEVISYEGQPLNNRLYHHGFENYFEQLNNLDTSSTGMEENRQIMKELAERLKFWKVRPFDSNFRRTIIGMESPVMNDGRVVKEGKEVVVAEWKRGFSSPVHGHGEGWLHEEVVKGRFLVHTYKIVNLEKKIVRPHISTIYNNGTLISTYTPENTHKMWKRESYVHSFVALDDYNLSLHYVPEHTRDGRDNTFNVEHFDLKPNEVYQIDSKQAMYSKVGDVILVRSSNVPDYGDHYIIITGAPVMKEHGLRPQDFVIQASPEVSRIMLDNANIYNGVTLLKLNTVAERRFKEFHGIDIEKTSFYPSSL